MYVLNVEPVGLMLQTVAACDRVNPSAAAVIATRMSRAPFLSVVACRVPSTTRGIVDGVWRRASRAARSTGSLASSGGTCDSSDGARIGSCADVGGAEVYLRGTRIGTTFDDLAE